MTQQFGDFQLEIYRDGMKGVLPRYPVDHAGLERKAAEALAPWILSYVAGGCGNEHTQRANVAAFEKWGIVPRMFNGSYERDLSIELFGMRLPTPLFTVPIGVIGVCSRTSTATCRSPGPPREPGCRSCSRRCRWTRWRTSCPRWATPPGSSSSTPPRTATSPSA